MTTKPDFENLEEYRNRSRKIEEIQSLGINPYPHTFLPSHNTAQLQKKITDRELGHSEDAAAGETPLVSVSGRLVLFRAMGKNAFAHMQDHTGRIQVMFNRDKPKWQATIRKIQTDAKPMKSYRKKI